MNKIQIDLSTDKGNVLEIIGTVARAIQKHGSRDAKNTFTTRVVRECRDYVTALAFCKVYAEKFDIEVEYTNTILPQWKNRV